MTVSTLLLQASAHAIPLKDASVQTVVTSPPYWGLRAYAGEQRLVWGGEAGHEHVFALETFGRTDDPHSSSTLVGTTNTQASTRFTSERGFCACGAWYGALGLEPTPELYVEHMVQVFREVRRVLRRDGTLWLNLGDSYYSTTATQGRNENRSSITTLSDHGANGRSPSLDTQHSTQYRRSAGDLKPKDLVGIPWRVAFALQADGWYLRSEVIWAKPNPMPESVTDRPTKSHEQLFLLAKGQWSERSIRFANLEPERVHLGRYLGAQNPAVSLTAKLGVEFATALFNGAQEEHDFRLPPFYAEEWKQLTDGSDSDLVANLPPEHRPAAHAARFLNGDATAKEFFCEVDRFWGDLRKSDHLLIGRSLTQGANPPHVLVDGDGSVRVDYPGQIGKIDFTHNRIVVSVPTTCTYFYDADAVREASTTEGERHYANSMGRVRLADPRDNRTGGHEGHYSPESGRNKRTVWTIPTRPYPGAHFACVDDLTEALTPVGWKRHADLADGEYIAAYGNGVLRWERATFHRYDYAGELVAIEKRDASQRLTPNHRVLVRRRGGETTVVAADDLRPGMEIPTAAPWVDPAGGSGPGATMAALVGWYVAEGHSHHKGYVEIYQSQTANPEHVAAIRALLTEKQADFRERTRVRDWRGRPSEEVTFVVRGGVAVGLQTICPDKRIPMNAITWPTEQVQALVDALIDGDGHRRADGRTSFIQKNEADADTFQALAARLGYRAVKAQRADGVFVVYLTRGEWLTLRGTNGRHEPIGRERYEGIVWCPSVPSGFWLARRVGRSFITGNTFPEDLVEPCILAGSSPKACGVCGAPWERVTDIQRGERDDTGRTHSLTEQRMGKSPVPEKGWESTRTTTGWRSTCAHDDDSGHSLVLDPFNGSGTTGRVAVRHGRSYVGLDISREYLVEQSKRRINNIQLEAAL